MATAIERPEESISALFAANISTVDQAAIKVYLAILDSGAAHRSAQSRLFHSLGTHRTQGRFAVLRALYFAENGTLTQREIRHDVRVTAPNISQLIDALERDGMVQRKVGQKDRRVTYVELTPKGWQLADALVPAMARLMSNSLDGFTDEEKARFHEFLIRFRRNVEGNSLSPAPRLP
ncbi:MAG TPA: MarR family transcriptional regulator [Dehalococcoidia bacterium]|nr:MarR family transcriptional regulator [Dehalococcoidia bacterium]